MLLIQTPLVVLNLEQDGVRLPQPAEQLWEANKLSDNQFAQKLSKTVFQLFFLVHAVVGGRLAVGTAAAMSYAGVCCCIIVLYFSFCTCKREVCIDFFSASHLGLGTTIVACIVQGMQTGVISDVPF